MKRNVVLLVLGMLVLLAAAAHAQVPAISPAGGVARGATAATGPSVRHDPHDLSGVWRWVGRVLTFSAEAPPMTLWGKARYDASKPSYGPRSIPASLGNDPQGKCDPLGIPRLLFYGAFVTIEFVPVKDRLFQFFEWGHVWRTIWTDGRKLSDDPDQDPRWMGYSVGHWDGDTFVVETNGMNENTWLDHFASPHSAEARLEERYRRLDRDTLELYLTLTDPKAYTKPWVSDRKTFKLEPARSEVTEIFCVPSEEELFNKRVRDPAGGTK
jgi:hypothetical protein